MPRFFLRPPATRKNPMGIKAECDEHTDHDETHPGFMLLRIKDLLNKISIFEYKNMSARFKNPK